MSNLNSPDSNLSSSNESGEPEAPREQRDLALLPAAYPLTLTEEYQLAFGSDALVPLPASYRLDFWRKHVGDPAWQREQAAAAEYNRQASEEYATRLAEVDVENRKRQEHHQELLVAYQKAKNRGPARLLQWKKSLKRFKEELEQKVIKEAQRNLERTLDRQEDAIREAVKQVAKITLYEKRDFPLTAYNPIGMKFAENLNLYGRGDARMESLARLAGVQKRYVFVPHGEGIEDCGDFYRVRFPLSFPESGHVSASALLSRRKCFPFGQTFEINSFDPPPSLQGFIDGIGRAVFRHNDEEYLKTIIDQQILYFFKERERKETFRHCLNEELQNPFVLDYLRKKHPDRSRRPSKPEEPQSPPAVQLVPYPCRPGVKTPIPPEPPSSCFDFPESESIEHVFKGSQVYGIEEVTTLARAHLFAGEQLRPYFLFGGVPFTISGGSPHMLIVGTTGSGKTTTLLRLMSSVLPLSRAQGQLLAERLANGKAPYPDSSHQWGRSLTHQAVVYNAKGEYLKYLEAFGFDSNVDLFNLDPADPNGYAWDVATDINDRESIEKFAEQLIPLSTAAARDKNLEFWLGAARTILEAVIVSFRNAARHAGKEPSWTLRDLVTAVSSEDSIKHILRWHDTPVQKVQECFGLSDAQASSVMMTLRECMRPFGLVGNRWYDAKNRGRIISLKKWALAGARSVLVLPNTKANISAYGPLNKSLFKALTDLCLKDENAFYLDEFGNERVRYRYLFIDELGQAGQFDELERLMTEGRRFGVHVVLGLHQLSQIRETYGENVSETIVGLCPYLACLKSNDQRTQKWMSEEIGTCLRSYEKESFSYTTSQGQTLTESSNTTQGASRGQSQSQNKGTTKGSSDTTGSSTARSHADQRSRTSMSHPVHGYNTTTGTTDSNTETTNKSRTDNESTTEGTTTGTSEQENWSSSSGASNAFNTTNSKGASKTRELRGEAAIEPHEFRMFPDPEKTGVCEGVYVTPTLPVWRTRLTMDQTQPEYAFPERLKQPSLRRTAEEDELVSRPREWTVQDLERLCLDKPHTLPPVPKMLILPDAMPREKQPKVRSVEQQSSLVHPEESDDHEPPLADFNY